MTSFRMYGPEQSDVLESVRDHVGFLPNVFAVLGANESVLQTFAGMNATFAEGGLSPIEREIVQTTVSVVNQCEYCVAGHTAFASMASLDLDAIRAIREDHPIKDAKLEALRRFTESVAETHGKSSKTQLEEFEAAGYSRSQVFDVILGVALKAFSNAVSGLTEIPLDEAFRPFSWSSTPTGPAINAGLTSIDQAENSTVF